MSQFMSGQPKIQEIIDAARGPVKCRIPLRLPAGSQKPVNFKAETQHTLKSTKPKAEVVTVQQPRFGMRSSVSQPRSGETRPKSANQSKDDSVQTKVLHMPPPRLCRPERERPAPKRPTNPKKVLTDISPSKATRPVITVPLSQKPLARSTYTKPSAGLPSQDAIKMYEELELQKGESSETTHALTDFNEGESITSRSDKVVKIKVDWQEKLVQFEKMKNDLTGRQKALMEVYAAIRCMHQEMTMLGQNVPLPPADDLRIMNVDKLTPEQLLQLCANVVHKGDDTTEGSIDIDIKKLYNMPSKLISSCELSLKKRKEIIDWFDNLKTQEKGITMSTLSKKISEFNAENEMMKRSLELVKADFFKELNNIIEFVRKNVTETKAFQLQTEELNCALSDLNSQNADLRKQINQSDHLRYQTTKGRIEQLEKELKEERCKKIVIKDRLTKAEGQIKVGKEKVAQLEAALEQARSQTWTLERTVQQLNEQNKKLKDDFEKEFSKLTESIKENTEHLEEIADVREKLQLEKEDLEKRLRELSEYYSESLKNIKHEMNINVAKLIETEKKYDVEIAEKKQLESNIESLYAQLLETQLRVKDITKELEEKDLQLIMAKDTQQELEITKVQLETAKTTIEEYENRLIKQGEIIEHLERNLKESVKLEETLRNNMSNKDEYKADLEKKLSLLEHQLQERECKIESYEEQLSSLKNEISQVLDNFEEFKNLSDLHDMINQQRTKLLETTRQNDELVETLQRKDLEIQQHLGSLLEQESTLEQRDDIIRMLTKKEEEQVNLIQLMRNELNIRTQADAELNQQLMDKNVEIESLLTNVETRKQTISQLEKIILTLEDQTRKASQQRRKDEEKIRSLEEKVNEYETNMEYKCSIEAPSRNLDNFIKILEDELETCIETPDTMEHEQSPRQRYMEHYTRGKTQKFDYDIKVNIEHGYKNRDYNNMPTKMMMGKSAVKMQSPSTLKDQFEGDNLDRKRGIMNKDYHNSNSVPEPAINVYNSFAPDMDNLIIKTKRKAPNVSQRERNLPSVIPPQIKDCKQFKMFKFSGHKL